MGFPPHRSCCLARVDFSERYSGRPLWQNTGRRRLRDEALAELQIGRLPVEEIHTRHPEARCHAAGGIQFLRQSQSLRRGADPFGKLAAALSIGLGEDHAEFLSAIAAHHISGEAGGFPKDGGDPAQAFVAGQMPLAVIVALEEVDIRRDHGDLSLSVPSAPNLGREQFVEVAAIEKPGQVILASVAFEPLIGVADFPVFPRDLLKRTHRHGQGDCQKQAKHERNRR
jgi:hypothetical protein